MTSVLDDGASASVESVRNHISCGNDCDKFVRTQYIYIYVINKICIYYSTDKIGKAKLDETCCVNVQNVLRKEYTR